MKAKPNQFSSMLPALTAKNHPPAAIHARRCFHFSPSPATTTVPVAAILLGLGAIPGFAGDATWNGGTDSWNNAVEWTSSPPGEYPKNGNAGENWNATIIAGSVALDVEDIAIQQLTLSGGALTGAFNLTTADLMTLSSGSMSGSGMTTANGGVLMDNSSAILLGRTLTNPVGKTATMSGASSYLYLGTSAVFNNAGTFLAQSLLDSYGLWNWDSLGATFNNSGTFTRNTGTGMFVVQSPVVFNNTGTTNVETGTLTLLGGDGGSTTGDFNVSSGATLNFASNFTFADTASFAGAGQVLLSGGTSTFNGTFNSTAAEVSLTGGTLTGTGTFESSGLLKWSGGTMNGPGTTGAFGGILLDGGFGILSERTLLNSTGSTATMSNDSYLYLGTGAVFNNAGNFLAQSTQDGYGLWNWDNLGGTFNNNGTFTRNTGTGTFVVQSLIVFNNTGTTNVETGTLALQGGDGGSTTGDFNVSSGATLNFASDFTFADTASFAGAGQVLLSGGTSTFDGTFNSTAAEVSLAGGILTGTGTFESSGLLKWSGGTMNGPGTTGAFGGMLLDNSSGILSERTLLNSTGSTATMSNVSYLYLGTGAVFNNAGTFLAQSTQDGYGLLNWDNLGGTFNNNGTFTRNTGTGTFVVQSLIVFNNTGTTNVQTGTLALQGGDGGSTIGDFNVSGGATLNFASNFNLAASVAVAGAGTVEFSNGTIEIEGSLTTPTKITGATVNFNSNNLTIPSIIQTGGTLGGAGAIATTGLLTWSGGTMTGGGTTTANGGILMDTYYVNLTGRTLNNPSGQTATMSDSSYLQLGSGGIFNNGGTFLAQVTQDGYGILDGGGGGTFNNSGTFTRNTGTGNFVVGGSIVFNNTGTTNVQNGTLALQGGDGGSTTGDFNVSSGATLKFASDFNLAASVAVAGAGTVDFSSGTIEIDGSYNVTGASTFTGATVNFNDTITSLGTGPLNISAGTANFNANNLTVSAINQTGGTLGGSGTITSTGLLTWSSGTMNGVGTTTANGNILMDNSSGILSGRTLTNSTGRTATMSNVSNLYLGTGAVFNNAGTFLAQSAQEGYGLWNWDGLGATFNNNGTFTRNTGIGTFVVQSPIVFNNTGTTNVQTGTLTLQGGDGGSTTGDFNVSGGATLNFASNFNLAASVAVAGAGTAEFSNGTIEIDGSLTSPTKITGATVNFNSNNLTIPSIIQTGGTLGGAGAIATTGLLTWSGGTMTGGGTTTANGGILMDTYYVNLTGRTLNNPSGQTATMSDSSYLQIGSGGTFNNGGTFLAQVTQDGYGILDGGGGGAFNNSGTFTRNTGTGSFVVGSSIVFNNTGTTNVQTGTLNLQAATVTQYSADSLTAGIWFVGPGAQLSLPSTDNGVVTNQADITLSGSGSVIVSGPASSTLESTLTTSSGKLRVLAGRSYTATAGAFSNTGILQLGGGTFSSASGLTNTASGEIFGFGAIAHRPTNSGIIRSAGGGLDFFNGIQSGSGTVQIDAGSTMNVSAGAASGSSADFLIHNGNTVGSLNLGTKTFSVGIDYTNANFGTGNAFAPRANVSGSGGILAVGGTGQTLGGSVSSGATATPVMAFGKLHIGAATTLNYQINNTGASGSRLRGAIQTTVNGGNLTDPRLTGSGVTAGNFGAILPGGNTGSLPVTFTASSAGALTGQAVRVLNNFDNVADQTLSITGSAYRYAAPSAHSPEPIAFGNHHVGDTLPAQLLTISNQAANDGFSESLNASIGGATGGVTTNGGSFTALAPGSSNSTALSVGIGTGSAGSKNGTATIILNSNGTGSSELGLTALTSQTVTVTGSVYRLAQPVLPGGTSLNFGIVHVGDTAQQTVNVNNTAANDGFSESLNGSFSGNAGHLTGSGSFTALAPGAASSSPKVTLDTSTAGAKSGTSTFALVSNGAGSSGLANTSLASQVISAIGQVNNYATAAISKDSGTATFSGSGSNYTVSFGRRTIGETSPVVVLRVTNSAAAPADTLAGSFITAAPDFTLSGFGAFSNVGAGQSQTSLNISLQTDTLGTFSQTITLNGLGQNTSGYSGALGPITITLTGEVAAVPELKIQLAGLNAVLSWPLAEQDWVLKKGDNLTGWTTVTEPVVNTATEHTVTTPRGVDPKLFFRLQK